MPVPVDDTVRVFRGGRPVDDSVVLLGDQPAPQSAPQPQVTQEQVTPGTALGFDLGGAWVLVPQGAGAVGRAFADAQKWMRTPDIQTVPGVGPDGQPVNITTTTGPPQWITDAIKNDTPNLSRVATQAAQQPVDPNHWEVAEGVRSAGMKLAALPAQIAPAVTGFFVDPNQDPNVIASREFADAMAARRQQEQQIDAAQGRSWGSSMVRGAAESTADMLPWALAPGASAAGKMTGMIGNAALQQGLSASRRADELGLTGPQRDQFIASDVLAETVPELAMQRLGMPGAEKLAATMPSAVKSLFKAGKLTEAAEVIRKGGTMQAIKSSLVKLGIPMAEEIGTEELTTILQYGNELKNNPAAKPELGQQVFDTAAQTALQTLALGGPSAVVNYRDARREQMAAGVALDTAGADPQAAPPADVEDVSVDGWDEIGPAETVEIAPPDAQTPTGPAPQEVTNIPEPAAEPQEQSFVPDAQQPVTDWKAYYISLVTQGIDPEAAMMDVRAKREAELQRMFAEPTQADAVANDTEQAVRRADETINQEAPNETPAPEPVQDVAVPVPPAEPGGTGVAGRAETAGNSTTAQESSGAKKDPIDLTKISESAIAAFPDMQQSTEGLIPLSRFTPDEAKSLRDAGIVRTETSADGRTYEGVDEEYLWRRRKQLQEEQKAQRDARMAAVQPGGGGGTPQAVPAAPAAEITSTPASTPPVPNSQNPKQIQGGTGMESSTPASTPAEFDEKEYSEVDRKLSNGEYVPSDIVAKYPDLKELYNPKADPARDALSSLTRTELVATAKQFGIKANLTTPKLIDAIAEKQAQEVTVTTPQQEVTVPDVPVTTPEPVRVTTMREARLAYKQAVDAAFQPGTDEHKFAMDAAPTVLKSFKNRDGSWDVGELQRVAVLKRGGVTNRATRIEDDDISMSVVAYHGSPHRDIEKTGGFSTEKIGTGEGAQTYGHGLYFADKKGVAEHYRKMLTRGGNKGQLYKVELAPEEDEYLLWDKPLSEQSDKVKAALEEASTYEEMTEEFKAWLSKEFPSFSKDFNVLSSSQRRMILDEYTHSTGKKSQAPFNLDRGSDFYEMISSALGSYKAASEHLLSLGIRGIKHLDGSSRSKGDGDYNYVIFDDADVKITDTFYSRAASMPAPTRDTRVVENAIRRLNVKSAVPSDVVMVKTLNDMPENVRAKYADQTAKGGSVRAMYDRGTGKTYFILSEIAAGAKAEGVSPDVMAAGIYFHEMAAHHGLNVLPKPVRDTMIARVIADVPMAEMKSMLDPAYHNMRLSDMAEEYIAAVVEMARTEEGRRQLGTDRMAWWDRLWNWVVRNVLRRSEFKKLANVPKSVRVIADQLIQGLQDGAVRGGPQGVGQAAAMNDIRFAQSSKGSPSPTPLERFDVPAAQDSKAWAVSTIRDYAERNGLDRKTLTMRVMRRPNGDRYGLLYRKGEGGQPGAPFPTTPRNAKERLDALREMMVNAEEKQAELARQRKRSKERWTPRNIWKSLESALANDTTYLPEQGQEAVREIRYSDGATLQYARDIKAMVYKPLVDAGVSETEFGAYLVARRAATERAAIQNPGDDMYTDVAAGMSGVNAREVLAQMERENGPERWAAITKAGDTFTDLRKKHVIPKLKTSGLFTQEWLDKVENNDNYSTFEVLEYMDATLGGETKTARVYAQAGTAKDINNPFYATITNDRILLHAAAMNKGKLAVVDILEQNGMIEPADMVGESVRRPDDPRKGIIRLREDGKVKAYYVDGHIARVFDSPKDSLGASLFFRFLQLVTVPQKMLYTTLYPIFGVWNAQRDVRATVRALPKTGFGRMFMEMALTAPSAFKDAFRRESDPLMREMLEANLLITGRTWSALEADDEVTHFERMNKFFDLDRREQFIARAAKAATTDFNQFFERWTKLAAFRRMKALGYAADSPQMKKMIRELAGSPDFLARGTLTRWLNSVFIFSNPAVQGLRQVVRGAKNNPLGFAMKVTMYTAVPAIIQAVMEAGLFAHDDDDDKVPEAVREMRNILDADGWMSWLRDRYARVPERDKMLFNTVPIADDNDSTGYVPLPIDHAGQIVHAFTRKAVLSLLGIKSASTAKLTASSVPWNQGNLNQFLDLIMDAGLIWSGVNPQDEYTGQPTIDPTIFEAGGKDVGIEFAKQKFNDILGSIAFKFDRPYDVREKTPAEKAGATPFLGPAMRRFYRVEQRGLADTERLKQQDVDREKAGLRKGAKEFIQEFIPGNEKKPAPYAYRQAVKSGAIPKDYPKASFNALWRSALKNRNR